MDPSHRHARGAGLAWLPRTRGDGPFFVGRTRSPRRWLPRTRGDGPPRRRRRSGGQRDARPPASPHTRGWTRELSGVDPDRFGFPAHAGMDPRHALQPVNGPRLPRTRGDGPVGGQPSRTEARGFPAHAGMDPMPPSGSPLCRDPGFPAHAGMDRGRAPPPPRLGSAAASPHTRGWTRDVVVVEPREASPHTRGWTRLRSLDRSASRRLPRTRGDGPDERRRGAALGLRLPRTRGDGPGARVEGAEQVTRASPHTRGWTRLAGRRWGRLAEASPHTRGWTPGPHPGCGPERLPRTRGDGPMHHVAGPGPSAAGFPAHAGMDPGRSGSSGCRSRASPHTRGWTVRRRRLGHVRRGFPAHAGMDPRIRRRC